MHDWNLAINQFMIWCDDRLPSTFSLFTHKLLQSRHEHKIKEYEDRFKDLKINRPAASGRGIVG